jgi:hypothetical protein
MNAARPQSSTLLNINDSIQVHLLVETALGDSREFELLSQEEVDELKRQCQTLAQRIEQTRQNLAIQSKYRDAARSMSKLYGPMDGKKGDAGDGKRNRRSLLGNRNSQQSEQSKEAEQERLNSERKCEDLARELWDLEKRLMEPQRRLLQHTAGILQMTHKGPKNMPNKGINRADGAPGSPESMLTYHNARSSMDALPEDNVFDERSLYRAADSLESWGSSNKPESQNRKRVSSGAQEKSRQQIEQQMKTIAQTEQKLEDLNSRLREVIIKVNPQRGQSYAQPPYAPASDQGADQAGALFSSLSYLEQGLSVIDEDQARSVELSQQLDRDSQSSRRDIEGARLELEDAKRETEGVRLELDNVKRDMGQALENAKLDVDSARRELETARTDAEGARLELEAVRTDAEGAKRDLDTVREQASTSTKDSEAAMEEKVEELNRQVRSLLLPFDSNRPEPPQLSGMGLSGQLAYFQESVGAIEVELARATAASSKNTATQQDNFDQMETVLMGLWEIIQANEEEMRQQKRNRRQARVANGEPDDKSDMDEDDFVDGKPFSLQAFSAKVQQLTAQVANLKEQKEVLQRQVKQQRELNNRSDASKDAELAVKAEEQRRLQALLERTEKDADNMREQLAILVKQSRTQGDAASGLATAQASLNQANDQIALLEEELQDLKDDHNLARVEMQSKITESESALTALKAELATSTKASTEVEELRRLMASKEEELEEMSMKVAELQTEVTIARADLDGAYGSRAQRAADAASNPAIQREIDDLNVRNLSLVAEIEALRAAKQEASKQSSATPELEARVTMLQRELSETIEEYENMTKASIDWEKDREALERLIDQMREDRESLEVQLSDEKVRWMGMKSPGSGPEDGMALGGAGATSTTVLKNEFKKMMRDARAESARLLRVSL